VVKYSVCKSTAPLSLISLYIMLSYRFNNPIVHSSPLVIPEPTPTLLLELQILQNIIVIDASAYRMISHYYAY
jgi:hypothetical protein